MSHLEPTRWCPHCRKPTENAPLPQLAGDAARLAPLSPLDDAQAFHRKLYCLECRAIWEAVELPAEELAALLEARDQLEEARRQMAMLRLLLAKERQAQANTAAAPDDKPLLRIAG